MSEKELHDLRTQLEKALQKERTKEALELLQQLETREPSNARWPHRRGDILRRAGSKAEAVKAFERATDLYAQAGFVARAVAMAKTILLLDASRTDILERVDTTRAKEIHNQNRIPTAITGAGQASLLQAAKQLDARTSSLVRSEPSAPLETRSILSAGKELDIDLDLSEMEVGERPLAAPSGSAEAEEPSLESLAVMPLFSLFAQVPKEALNALATGSELIERSDKDVVVRRGDPADALYAIVEGCARVEVPGLVNKAPVLLVEGELFGESCLFENEPRNADVVVFGQLVALRIPRAVVMKAVREFPAVGDVLFELSTRRLVGNLLQTSPLFSAFDTKTRREVARLFQVHRVPRGTFVLQEGTQADGLYLPLSGRFEVDDGRSVGPGGIVGQASLLAREFSAHSVRAGTEMAVLRLPADAFGALAAQYPPVLAHLASLDMGD